MPPADPPRRSCCPIACTLDLIGDRWTLLVLRDLFAGRTRYSDFQRSPEGIATNILADRLELLVRHDLVDKHAEGLPNRRGHHTYRLTDKGRSLEPVLWAVAHWGLQHIEGTEARIVPPGATRERQPDRSTP